MGLVNQFLKQTLKRVLPANRYLLQGPHGVAITFDDGPDPEITPHLLDLLAAHDMTATFFVIGRKLEANPELGRRIVEEGHAIGNHTWSHSEPANTPLSIMLEEVHRTSRLIADVTGVETNLFRPPKGELGWGKLRGLLSAKQQIVLWSADPKDWAMDDSLTMRKWCKTHSPAEGEIILMHDNHRWCLDAIPELAGWRALKGTRFVSISDWTGTREPSLKEELSHV